MEATEHRMRPIMLTAAAASLALIPIAREIFWGPMAYAMMGGIIVGTVLTLLFLPALYVAWFRIKEPEPEMENIHENPLAPEAQANPSANAPTQPRTGKCIGATMKDVPSSHYIRHRSLLSSLYSLPPSGRMSSLQRLDRATPAIATRKPRQPSPADLSSLPQRCGLRSGSAIQSCRISAMQRKYLLAGLLLLAFMLASSGAMADLNNRSASAFGQSAPTRQESNAASDQRFLTLFRAASLSLTQAIAIAERLNTGSRTAAIAFVVSAPPAYRVTTVKDKNIGKGHRRHHGTGNGPRDCMVRERA